MLKAITLSLMFSIGVPIAAFADSENAKVIYQDISQGGGKFTTKTIALINMDDVFDAPLDNCSQVIGAIKVEGVQFSPSGITVESFSFTKGGSRMAVPTNIGGSTMLSNVDKGHASEFIKVGKRYLAHIQVCGSGGFPSLISLYAL